ncbi:hypothetical protein DESUT3_01360 [Desulfuromonas versatilis]|uniref:Uncharacterized protein n=1 Tax=Desulfuromonas versatilis TaxID=2802975 RepID=A0ABN6DTK8_9BACT|nr:DUF5752 family protein [Desulfuromonas versatilis]BCR03067.1 hypothetical protein DESUT3_01360 [Desulfuromonas versatilis]
MEQPGSPHNDAIPFAVRDCALITIATGIKAQNLREFRDGLQRVPAGSIYHHFWGRLLRPQFDEPEYNSDFASWTYHGLHEKRLAEQLSVISPTDFDDLEALRQELIEIVEQRLEESELVPWARADQQFHFLHSQIVVFDSGLHFRTPEGLVPYLPSLSTGSIYYHFIDARKRTAQRCDDFSAWLEGFGAAYQPLVGQLRSVDPYFSSLKEIRQILSEVFQEYFEVRA